VNCKPGDLAIVVACPPHAANAIGSIVRCVRRWDEMSNVGPMWYVEPPARSGHIGIGDRWLRPIRDPGDDARDETLTWLPVPTRESTPA
jgi:hypothetical protein